MSVCAWASPQTAYSEPGGVEGEEGKGILCCVSCVCVLCVCVCVCVCVSICVYVCVYVCIYLIISDNI